MFALAARKDADTEEFRQFKRTLTHDAIANILLPIKPFMTTPDIVRCADHYFRRVLYGLGPHISDYPEQAIVAWILMNWCPTYVRLLIYSLGSPTETPIKVSCTPTLARHPLPSENGRSHSGSAQYAYRRRLTRGIWNSS